MKKKILHFVGMLASDPQEVKCTSIKVKCGNSTIFAWKKSKDESCMVRDDMLEKLAEPDPGKREELFFSLILQPLQCSVMLI